MSTFNHAAQKTYLYFRVPVLNCFLAAFSCIRHATATIATESWSINLPSPPLPFSFYSYASEGEKQRQKQRQMRICSHKLPTFSCGVRIFQANVVAILWLTTTTNSSNINNNTRVMRTTNSATVQHQRLSWFFNPLTFLWLLALSKSLATYFCRTDWWAATCSCSGISLWHATLRCCRRFCWRCTN